MVLSQRPRPLDSALVPSAPASLYRRHRPRTFDDVVGQDHVVRTLRNAIEQGKVHHAYLFVGSRGTGKTSMAKILAASLNCVQGPTVTPCGECESCVAIANATSLDVIEMDAASNNSVDDIRDLRERVGFAPVSGSHKVYILDEAHMLSTAAWNAFLKTLEEPPPHTIFVLATTEANKVLPTVVDRCHRFDFARPSVQQIAGVVGRVATAEDIEIGDEAAALVARAATGSFRDALGTLEQLVAYSGRSIALEDVLAVLGAADADLVFGAVDAVAAGDARAALLASARLAESGRDLGRFFSDLEAHARALMVVQALGEVPAELRITPEQDERLAAQAKAVAPADVIRLLDMIAAALRALKDGADARTQLELALVKAAEPAHDPTVKALLARIQRLEARAGGSPPAPAARAPSEPATAAGRTRVAVTAQVEDQPPVAASTTLPGAPEGGAPEAQKAAAEVAAAVSEDLDANVTAVAVVEPDAPTPSEPSLELSLDAFADMWPAVIESLEGENGLLAALLREATPLELSEQSLTLAWPESAAFLKRQAEDPAKRELLAESIRAVTGASLRLAFELRADDEVAQAGETIDEDELVDRFKREFSAVEEPPPTEET
jgi:DNA polymerase III subunit gamma/tau